MPETFGRTAWHTIINNKVRKGNNIRSQCAFYNKTVLLIFFCILLIFNILISKKRTIIIKSLIVFGLYTKENTFSIIFIL